MIREALSGLARQPAVGGVLSRTPGARDVVHRLVGGDTVEEAVDVASRWADQGYWTALEWVPESEVSTMSPEVSTMSALQGPVTSPEPFPDLVTPFPELIKAMASSVAASCELVLVPERLAASGIDSEALLAIAVQAHAAGLEITIGTSPDTSLVASLGLADRLHEVGVVARLTVPSSWRMAEDTCRERADLPIRLVKGTRTGQERQTFRQPIEIDKSFVRCAKALTRGPGLPSFSTHDERLIEMVEVAAARAGREPGDYELCFFLGRGERSAERAVREGHRVRLYIPFGPGWYGRLMAGLAEQSSSLGAAVRSLLPGA